MIHERPNAVGQSFSPTNIETDEMDWDAYAEHYDEMCALNPAYQENIDLLLSRVRDWNLPARPRVCDLGAGTGNYICALSSVLPNAEFVHVDFDHRMNQLASEKYERLQVRKVSIVEGYAQSVDFPENYFDLIVSVNALYAISPQTLIAERVRKWLTPEGRFFVIDFGRPQNTLDWTLYVLRESAKRGQLKRYIRALIEAREVLRQNRKTKKGQHTGRYWTHTATELGSLLTSAGLHVEELSMCYRGYADFAAASKGISAIEHAKQLASETNSLEPLE